jgi:exodeoxyribonuclease V beta subunit
MIYEKPFDVINAPLKGLNLIEANAGTGKTFTISLIFLRLILEQQLNVSQILVVTFTENATNELKKRIYDLLIEADLIINGKEGDPSSPVTNLFKEGIFSNKAKLSLKKAILELDEANIFTIHGFCKRILTDYAFETNNLFNTILKTNSESIIKESFYDFLRMHFFSITPKINLLSHDELFNEFNLNTFFSDLKSVINKPNLEFIKDQKKTSLYQFFSTEFRKSIKNFKRENNLLTFDDLILNLFEAVKNEYADSLVKSLNKKFKAVLIDEFQDTDIMQYEIFNELFLKNKEAICFLIGDPKQSIYAFRGADLFSYHKVKDTVKQNFFLANNFRSDPGLISAINTVFNQERVFLYDWLKYKNSEPPLEKKKEQQKLQIKNFAVSPFEIIYFHSDLVEKQNKTSEKIKLSFIKEIIAKDVGHKILNLLDEGIFIEEQGIGTKINLKDIAILVRKNTEIFFMKDHLNKLGLKTLCYFDENIFETNEAEDFLSLLQVINNPTNPKLIKKSLITPFFNFTLNTLSEINDDFSFFEGWINKFSSYKLCWQRFGFAAMVQSILKEEQIKEKIVVLEDGEKLLNNYLHLFEILQDADYKNKFTSLELISWLETQQLDANVNNETLIRIDTDDDAVKIMTVHKCKGLEFPIVFCPYIWGEDNNRNSFFHNPAHDFKLTLDLETAKDNLDIKKEGLSENSRLLYVSLTRAKNAIYLYWGNLNIPQINSQYYLFHICASIKSENDLESWLADPKKSKKSSQDMLNDLKSLENKSKGSIHVNNYFEHQLDQSNFSLCKKDKVDLELKAIKLNPELKEKKFSILSYTGLVNSDKSIKSSLIFESLSIPKRVKPANVNSIMDLPHGKKTGIFLHEVLAQIDFQNLDHPAVYDFIVDLLVKYNYEKSWAKFIVQDLKTIFDLPLDKDNLNFKLSNIATVKKLNEVKFYYPLQQISKVLIYNLFVKFSHDNQRLKNFSKVIKLPFNVYTGFMEGIIDLIFTHQGKFYLIDWKTNFLGLDSACYSQNNLFKSILDENYFLQYYFYVIGFDQYLRTKLPQYQYDLHFGGVYYLFLRGMNKPDFNGIYYDHIPKDLLEALRKEILKENG